MAYDEVSQPGRNRRMGAGLPTPGVSPSSTGTKQQQGNKAWPDTKCMFAIDNYYWFLNVFHLARTMLHRLDTLSRSNSSGDDWNSVYALYLSSSFAVMISGLPWDLLRIRAELSTHQIKPAPVVPPSLYMAWSFSFQHPLPLEFTARLQPLLYFLTLLLFQPPWFSRLFFSFSLCTNPAECVGISEHKLKAKPCRSVSFRTGSQIQSRVCFNSMLYF